MDECNDVSFGPRKGILTEGCEVSVWFASSQVTVRQQSWSATSRGYPAISSEESWFFWKVVSSWSKRLVKQLDSDHMSALWCQEPNGKNRTLNVLRRGLERLGLKPMARLMGGCWKRWSIRAEVFHRWTDAYLKRIFGLWFMLFTLGLCSKNPGPVAWVPGVCSLILLRGFILWHWSGPSEIKLNETCGPLVVYLKLWSLPSDYAELGPMHESIKAYSNRWNTILNGLHWEVYIRGFMSRIQGTSNFGVLNNENNKSIIL